jgi:apolipoprotein N-acyltransferase
MKRALISFGAGILAAASLPQAGWTNFIYDLTPWSFPLYALAVYWLYRQISEPYLIIHAYLWASGYFLFGLSWVGNALLVGGNPYAWAWPLAVIGLPLLLSFFLAIILVVLRGPLMRASSNWRPLVFAAAFTLAELARGYLFTGFPWNLPAMYWSETLVVFQILSLIGPYGLSFLTILWAVVLGDVLQRLAPRAWPGGLSQNKDGTLGPSPRGYAAPLLILGLTIIYGAFALNMPAAATTPLSVVMVQANIPQSEKWNADHFPDHFYRHIELSQATQAPTGPTMIIWPETALPPSYVDDTIVRGEIKKLLATYPKGSTLVTGALRVHQDKFYNAVIAYDQTGTPSPLYDKYHLVPFGEYMPFQKYIPFGPVAAFENMSAGDGPRTVTTGTLPPFRPLVCYEVIFPAALTHNAGPERFILNVTNDAWYDHAPGPYQHLAAARARAIERGLPLVRVAGTGISAAFDAQGRLLGQIGYNQAGAINVSLPLTDSPSSSIIPTVYLYTGDLFIALIVLIVLLSPYFRHFY